MGKHIGLSLVLIFLIFFLPWLWAQPAPAEPGEPGGTLPPPADSLPDQEPAPEDADPPAQSLDAARSLRVKTGCTLTEMDMETYLLGVVRAEMPASFELEALKAQTVAARTYVLHKMLGGGSANHPEADVCDDITCCQAYLSQADAAAGWGAEASAYEAKIRRAVTETDGQCILYEGAPILAAFHSSTSGMTQDAADVWSSGVPYLKSVESPEDEATVPNYRSTAEFSAAELKARLLEAIPDADLSGTPSNWFTNIQQQPSGTVTSLSVGGVTVSGNRLRTILDLRSACFTVAFQEDTVAFSVTGYGHGVGMSQYGANVLAAGGMDYRDILAWYYSDTTVDTWTDQATEGSPST